jgi:hypothetical protein
MAFPDSNPIYELKNAGNISRQHFLVYEIFSTKKPRVGIFDTV